MMTCTRRCALALGAWLVACGATEQAERPSSVPSGARAGSGASANAAGGDAQGFGNAMQPMPGTVTAGGGAIGASGAAGLGEQTCARADVGVTRLIPTVEVVVDASGSMAEPFVGCPTRWQCLRDALIGDQGLITALQSTVRFGLTLYGGQIARVENGMVIETLDPTCPRRLHVTNALDNHATIAAPYQLANPAGGTPTAEALEPIVDALPDVTQALDQDFGPQIILLVTDGDPNTCVDPVTTDYAPTEAQALRAQQKHIRLFVITVADDQNAAHLQRMANLGAGMAADALPGAPFFDPNSAADLTDTLREIVGGAVGCEVKLEGKVSVKSAGDECRGDVALNGEPLACNEADGWRLLDASTIELQGAACERFKFDASVMLHANFPCDLLVVE